MTSHSHSPSSSDANSSRLQPGHGGSGASCSIRTAAPAAAHAAGGALDGSPRRLSAFPWQGGEREYRRLPPQDLRSRDRRPSHRLDLDVGARLISVDLQEHVADAQGRAVRDGRRRPRPPPRRPFSRDDHRHRHGFIARRITGDTRLTRLRLVDDPSEFNGPGASPLPGCRAEAADPVTATRLRTARRRTVGQRGPPRCPHMSEGQPQATSPAVTALARQRDGQTSGQGGLSCGHRSEPG